MTSQPTDTGAKERAQETASTAADEGRHVAGVAKEQTAQVASEAAAAAKNVASDVLKNVSDTAREQGGTQRDKLVSTLSTLTDDLSSMADQAPSGLAGDIARQAADQARSLTSRMENRDHYMKATMLDSQLATLEPLTPEPFELAPREVCAAESPGMIESWLPAGRVPVGRAAASCF